METLSATFAVGRDPRRCLGPAAAEVFTGSRQLLSLALRLTSPARRWRLPRSFRRSWAGLPVPASAPPGRKLRLSDWTAGAIT